MIIIWVEWCLSRVFGIHLQIHQKILAWVRPPPPFWQCQDFHCFCSPNPSLILPGGRMREPVDHSDGAEGDNDSNNAGRRCWLVGWSETLLVKIFIQRLAQYQTSSPPRLSVDFGETSLFNLHLLIHLWRATDASRTFIEIFQYLQILSFSVDPDFCCFWHVNLLCTLN